MRKKAPVNPDILFNLVKERLNCASENFFISGRRNFVVSTSPASNTVGMVASK
ncbi:hypothetical protein [Peribacillus butanolivorans]